jgi:hypothetical protein
MKRTYAQSTPLLKINFTKMMTGRFTLKAMFNPFLNLGVERCAGFISQNTNTSRRLR